MRSDNQRRDRSVRREAGTLRLTRGARRSCLGLALGVIAAGQVVLLPTAASAVGANLTVSTTADVSASTGACGNPGITAAPSPLSLREALCLADNLGGAVTVNVPAGHYVLANGELAVGQAAGQNVTIAGAGSGATIIDAAHASRVLDIDQTMVGGVTTAISGVTITGGTDSTYGGGGIIGGSGNAGALDALSIASSTITDNHVGGTATNRPGGGVQFLGGQLTITNSTISNNSSGNSSGSGVEYQGYAAVGGEHATITNTTFADNSATSNANIANGGALALSSYNGAASYDVTNSRFVHNTVTGSGSGIPQGGAIWSQTGTLHVTGSTFTDNAVSGGTSPQGGAISITGGTATVHYSRLVRNTAAGGGAVFTAGALDAASNWWGCNTGPGTSGCDAVAGPVNASPRLMLTASASPSTVTGPNGTSSITARLTQDSLGATVGGAQLGGFDAAPVTWSDPAGDATVDDTSSPFSSGQAATAFRSHTTAGASSVTASFDNASVTVPLTIQQAPAITSPDTASLTVGTPGSFRITTSGAPTPAISESGSLPPGVTFTDNGDGSATLGGTPTASGTFPLTVTATNGATPAATQTLTVTVGQAPVITSTPTSSFTVGSAGSFTITSTGAPSPSLTTTGSVPAGLTFVDHHDGTATLSGTPAAGSAGPHPLTVTAANGINPDAVQTLTISITEAPAVTTDPADRTIAPGDSVTFTAAASGTPQPTVQWQRSTDGGAGFTNIPGATATSYSFPVATGDTGSRYRAVFTNSAGTATTTDATLTVGNAPGITSLDAATFTVGTPGSFNVTTSGFPTGTLTTTGTLPAWLTFTDAGNGTGTLTGTPPAGSAGTATFSLHADNGFDPAASQDFTLSVHEAPSVSTDPSNATVATGQPVTFTAAASGTPAPSVQWEKSTDGGATFTDVPDATAASLTFPAALNDSNSRFRARFTNAVGSVTSAAATLTVGIPAEITSGNTATLTAGSPGGMTITATGTPTPTLIASGPLPAGVTFVDHGDGSAALAGTPGVTAAGSYPITLTAGNGIGPAATQAFTLTVLPAPLQITTSSLPSGQVGSPYTAPALQAAGGTTPYTWSVANDSALPAGLTLQPNGSITGTPQDAGTTSVVVRATDAGSPTPQTVTRTLSVTVDPAPVTAPTAPTIGGATGGDGSATITFTPPSSNGGAPVTGYVVTSSPGNKTATGSASPLTVTGLTNGTSYTFTVQAINGVGTGPASAASNAVTPVAVTPVPVSPIAAKYAQLGGARSVLGAPIGEEYAVAGGRARDYQAGRIYYSRTTGAHEIHGAILLRYLALGGPTGLLGFPTSDESAVAGGRFNTFAGADGASIFWSAGTGAWSVHGAIRSRYLALGGPGGLLGFPTSDESAVAGGRFNTFAGADGASIFWSAGTGAWSVHGMIRSRYLALGGPGGLLGFPTSDESAVAGGRFNTFAGADGASIFWSSRSGAWSVHGAVRNHYQALGGPAGRLGYPVTDEYGVAGGRRSDFQHGSIVWHIASRTYTVSYR